ncbi:MAG: pyridoxine 5'-phosphate synthase [Pseudomonadales bacterium]|nr:pyridoxine 5'-phosphate synthase [Pseudomonadales bacterium]MCP5182430.1 pyridoxine 5'-phosphate synthase [Pseudomonadales bacterium]
MIALSVNVNKVAALRNSRGGRIPDVLEAARTVLAAGADGITVHPRPDQRHITPDDVRALARMLHGDYPDIEFNIEGNPVPGPRDNGYPGLDALVREARPAQVTLVPDGDNQLTSDHGFDLKGDQSTLRDRIRRYQDLGARVSLFMDADLDAISRVPDVGANRIELYTGPFADAVAHHGPDAAAALESLDRYRAAAEHARALGLGVNAGHDLNLLNLPLLATVDAVLEVSIGHALIADALYLGLERTVAAYLRALGRD